MDFGTQNDLLLVILGGGWLTQGDLGDRRGAQIDAKLGILTNKAHKIIENHQNNTGFRGLFDFHKNSYHFFQVPLYHDFYMKTPWILTTLFI